MDLPGRFVRQFHAHRPQSAARCNRLAAHRLLRSRSPRFGNDDSFRCGHTDRPVYADITRYVNGARGFANYKRGSPILDFDLARLRDRGGGSNAIVLSRDQGARNVSGAVSEVRLLAPPAGVSATPVTVTPGTPGTLNVLTAGAQLLRITPLALPPHRRPRITQNTSVAQMSNRPRLRFPPPARCHGHRRDVNQLLGIHNADIRVFR